MSSQRDSRPFLGRSGLARRILSLLREALPDPALPLERQLFQGLTGLAGVLCIFVIVPVNNYPSLDPWVNRLLILYGAITLGLAWAARMGVYLRRTFLVLTVVCLDLLWFPNGGSQGSIGLYFFLSSLLIAVFCKGAWRVGALGLLLANMGGLLWLERARPDLVTPFPHDLDRVVDLVTGYFISLPICALLVGLILWLHDRRAREAEASMQALRASEERVGSVFRNVPVAVLVQDFPRGPIRAANERFASVFGRDPASAIGRSLQDLGIWADPGDGERLLRRLEAGERIQDFEAQICRGDGAFQWVSLYAEVLDVEGTPTLLAGAVDITERRRLESERFYLEDRRARLKKSESIGVMAGSIAHHFNNKLQVALAGLEGVVPDAGSPGSPKRLDLARRALEEAAEVSQKMLISLGQLPAGREVLDWARTCGSTLERMRSALPEGVALDWASSACPCRVSGNEDLVRQVVVNLVTNSAESLREEGGTVRVAVGCRTPESIPARHRFPLWWQAKGDHFACLEIQDTGCGIDAEDLDRIFDPFYSTKFTGRGLGLPVTLGIVQAYGGLITVETRPGEGSTFRVFFPCEHAEDAETAEPSLGGTREGRAVLLVDDDEGMLGTAGELLGWLGYQAIPARSGLQALERFNPQPGRFACVLTDLAMPGMDGWQTLAALRRIQPDLPAVVMSGYDLRDTWGDASGHLRHVFLPKPFRMADLKEALERAMGAPQDQITSR